MNARDRRVTRAEVYVDTATERMHDERYQAAVLAYLEMCNWITPSEPQAKAGRRPSDLYLVNPEAHQRFSELAERERERRARLRADWLAAGQA